MKLYLDIIGLDLKSLRLTLLLAVSIAILFILEGVGIFILLLVPIIITVSIMLFKFPMKGIHIALILSFLISGLSRYLAIPWGLGIDSMLFLLCLGLLLSKKTKWKKLNNDVFILAAIWFLYLIFELFNPYGNGLIAWFYAMRGIGLYQLLTFIVIFTSLDKKTHIYTFLNIAIVLSLLGTVWGFKQYFGILDAAENHWLFAENHQEEHILHGVLRVFSFYSDAGQFGASQAMMSLLCGILFIGPFSIKQKAFYLFSGVLFFLGFAISGTRGALAVPAIGGIVYLIAIRNFKVLISGLGIIIIIFCLLKYTFLFQGVEQVRRMRTALDPNNPSLLVRLENQKTFGNYLKDKPFGAGIGTAGYWGFRFNPDSLLANTATDSWYVKIWVETGIIGIVLHLGFAFFVLGKGFSILKYNDDPRLKTISLGLLASIGGVMGSSYGNQVFGQMPTGMIMNIAIPMLFIIPTLKQIEDESCI